ncbi:MULTISPECIES: enoyl-CoA hydratase/isomerase family protein [Pseudomonas]|jgi:enoyl-CoA hydratase/carnithine racemase|uniref:Enoyl-CoA hydratase/isomerase family protein n=1 Tax=Pseudomonas mandelii TaxID=75612 RepID=A0AB36D5E1_9PSED|nr:MULTISPECIES: enoyl-CoA hydratase-related protein [Pseudomonas]MBU0526709.1 enoyl-CoA hydratase/isomerase family protein [Gammaproteobacteria bacterium]MDF9880494.1 enoyl-CoA hydratase/carnithine racemase [Pseudomonas silensiensis]MBA4362091.1 enoyl-CoA hydratase [Pseudomonas sp.]MBU0817285.1 enoyl-CoA hydratase/isomerase family protein [Gammaproteobacteria bacterium]MBU0839850.1 enoyl-CoA hydratase/isomerase family protein [Gammaproteobacteria bacterium]
MSVTLEVHGPVALITIDRPQALNALDLDSLQALRGHLREVRDRRELRVAVITGSGERAFCVGADLKSTRASSASYAEALFLANEPAADAGLYIRQMDLADLDLHKPLIAAINGHCLGGGLELALQCDLRIASASATFGLPEAAVGSIPAVSGLHRLMRAVPPAHAMQMALTGSRIDAWQACAIGLISERLDSHEALLHRAMILAEQIARQAPLAIQALQTLARSTAHLSDSDAQRLTELYWGVLRDTEDRLEGRQAFAEKRAPHYTGR